ncbi:MAG: hypothetical protein ACRC8A_08610 [Microcoleaceae cyanobacterium]
MNHKNPQLLLVEILLHLDITTTQPYYSNGAEWCNLGHDPKVQLETVLLNPITNYTLGN